MAEKVCCMCGRELTGWHYKYKGKLFCEYYDSKCLKNFLFDEADGQIEEDKFFPENDYVIDEDYLEYIRRRSH